MIKAKALTDGNGNHGGWVIACPACGYWHLFDSRWTFNGNEEAPTFRPSMLVNGMGDVKRCHSFVTDGKIEFLSDCDHGLANTTVDLPGVEA